MKKQNKQEYVTKIHFDREMKVIHRQFVQIDKRFELMDENIARSAQGLENKINRLAFQQLKFQEQTAKSEEVMEIKEDIRLILNRIDHFSKKVDVYDKKAIVQDYRLQQLEEKCGLS